MTSRIARLTLACTAFLLASGLIVARPEARTSRQDSSLRAERTIDFATGKAIPLDVKVGPVNVQTVEFSDRGRSGGGMMRTPVSETSTYLRAHFQAENPTKDERQVTFTVEFLDRTGKLIDRATKKSSWEGEAKGTDLDHPILQYAISQTARVRILMEARLD